MQINKDKNVHRYEGRGEKVILLMKKAVFLDKLTKTTFYLYKDDISLLVER